MVSLRLGPGLIIIAQLVALGNRNLLSPIIRVEMVRVIVGVVLWWWWWWWSGVIVWIKVLMTVVRVREE